MNLEKTVLCPKCSSEDVFYDGDSKRLKCMECNYTGTLEEVDYGDSEPGFN